MAVRVALFLDYQNVYRGARESFHLPSDISPLGQVDPLRLGRRLVGRYHDRQLTDVRVYRGRPDATKDPVGYAANRSQCAAWERDGVTVITRTLRYPRGWPQEREEEKGIDVALAVDFVTMAVRRQFDVGVLMSTDTDLKPALEAVVGMSSNPFPRCEVAAWSAPDRHSRRLSIATARLWCHWLSRDDYKAVADPTHYADPRG